VSTGTRTYGPYTAANNQSRNSLHFPRNCHVTFLIYLLTAGVTSHAASYLGKMAEDDIAECVGTQSFSDKQQYFARVDDAAFWSDRERVKTMIDLYEHYHCLWNIHSSEYKNINKKKLAKIEVGKHFGYSGTN